MQWIEVCIKTTSQAIELVGERLTMLGFDSFIMDDQDEFHGNFTAIPLVYPKPAPL